ncbi:MAG: right-handed parallel beta-helix repeat-containing protein, partial [Saprospiraceae bacterium]|nr:right-handed parallel beta-helix repeat-containing protein [Saprospiraceae bacterium]
MSSQAMAQGQVVYVDAAATGSNDGSSWADAYTRLEQAIQHTSSGQIWVAAGVYTPTTGTDPEISFFLKNNVKIYGGFQGTETALAERDTALFDDTVLSGEIGDTTWGDNCYHVVSNNTALDTSAVLDGFKITRGYGALGGGGGVFWANFAVGAIVRNCLIVGNYGYQGGGIRVLGGSGGEIAVFQHCTVANNTGSYRAGGFYADGDVRFEDCVFRDNGAPQGGCAYVGGNNSAFLSRCIFDRNSTVEFGAAMYADFGCNVVIENTLFTRNFNSNATNTIYAYNADLRMDNCTFSKNDNNSILGAEGSDVTVRGSIVWGNAGGMGILPGFEVRNCILQDFNGTAPPGVTVV